MLKNSFARVVAIIVAALVLAVVSNGFASRQRRLMLPGYYPNALRVPPPERETPPAPQAAPPAGSAPASATDTTASLPPATATAIGNQTPVVVSTATIAPAIPPVKETHVPAATATQPAIAPAPVPAPPAADVLARFTPHPDRAYVEISGADAAALHAKGVLFLDARRTSVYEEGHIAGARPFSVWESDVDEKVNALFNERSDPREQNLPIVIYCSGGACEDSHMLSEKLWGIQFNNIYVYKDGFPDWQKRGGAVKTGGQP